LDTLLSFLTLILHIDKSLGFFIQHYGAWVYAVLFLIVFCETGLVVFPFLPGDSLLFIGGAFAASGSMDLGALIVLLLVAAILGNTVNYWIGRAIGPKVFDTHIPVLERFLDRRARALRADRADVRALRGGGIDDESIAFSIVQHTRRADVGIAARVARLFLRQYPIYSPVSECDRVGWRVRGSRADRAGRVVESHAA
jgi:hypothetical protein